MILTTDVSELADLSGGSHLCCVVDDETAYIEVAATLQPNTITDTGGGASSPALLPSSSRTVARARARVRTAREATWPWS